MNVTEIEHSTWIGNRTIRRADSTYGSMPFARCTCGWEGSGQSRRSTAVNDAVEHLAAGAVCARCTQPKPDDGNDWCRRCEDENAADVLAALRIDSGDGHASGD